MTLAEAPVAASDLPPERRDDNLLDTDAALVEGLRREGASAFEDDCRDLGARLAGAQAITWGFEANEHPPGHRAPRPLGTARRRDPLPSRLARADGAQRRARGSRARRGPTTGPARTSHARRGS